MAGLQERAVESSWVLVGSRRKTRDHPPNKRAIVVAYLPSTCCFVALELIVK